MSNEIENNKIGQGISRRKFLLGSSSALVFASTVSLGMSFLKPQTAQAAASVGTGLVYGDWRDIYKNRWKWDKVVKSSHFVNCWYQAHCAWNVYVKDGMVWREEQVGEYDATNSYVPDPNPRGCQKGACYSERMYDPSRVKYPLKRVGERGSGKWQRMSWDDVTEEIANKWLDVIENYGPERAVIGKGPLDTGGAYTAGVLKAQIAMGAVGLDMNTEIGDGHQGLAEVFGKISFERSADDYFYSDLILIWGGNPVYTQIPNAHFLTEARYHGAEIITISCDFSASSVHSDHYVPVKPGSDAALALGMCHVIIEEGLVNEDFVREQTDLPLLVREDNGRFLRVSDVEGGENPSSAMEYNNEEFYFYSTAGALIKSSKRTLAIEKDKQPDLNGAGSVRLHNGETVEVVTVYHLLKKRIEEYTPEAASKMCGTPPAMIRTLSRKLARAKAACTTTSSNWGKYYHGNLIQRSQSLAFALCGQFGKKGSGYVGFPFLMPDGIIGLLMEQMDKDGSMAKQMQAFTGALKAQGFTDDMIAMEMIRQEYSKEGNKHKLTASTQGSLFYFVHGGLMENNEKLHEWDPFLKRPAKEYLEEALEKEWAHILPKPGDDPKAFFVVGSNPLRRVRGYPRLLENLWPKLDMIVTLDSRMSSTALQSDYVLPASAYYERNEIKWVTELNPILHCGEKAASYFDSKSDWEIWSRIVEKAEQVAKKRGMKSYIDHAGRERFFEGMYSEFSQNGKYGHEDDDKVVAALLEMGEITDMPWEEMKEKGFERIKHPGKVMTNLNTATDFKEGETITPLTKHVFDKDPYPSTTRRMQFYIDHEFYFELDEHLPRHKDSPTIGGDYPIQLTGGHTRWSIHSGWRDDKLMLQNQRGEPVMYVNTDDANARGVKDADYIRVYNDIDEFEVMAKVAPGIHPGQAIIYHAWDNFQFKNGKGFQNLMGPPLNPVELAGGMDHLRDSGLAQAPCHTDRDTKIDYELAKSA